MALVNIFSWCVASLLLTLSYSSFSFSLTFPFLPGSLSRDYKWLSVKEHGVLADSVGFSIRLYSSSTPRFRTSYYDSLRLESNCGSSIVFTFVYSRNVFYSHALHLVELVSNESGCCIWGSFESRTKVLLSLHANTTISFFVRSWFKHRLERWNLVY